MTTEELRLAIYRLTMVWTAVVLTLILLSVPFALRLGVGLWRAVDRAEAQAERRERWATENERLLERELERLRGPQGGW